MTAGRDGAGTFPAGRKVHPRREKVGETAGKSFKARGVFLKRPWHFCKRLWRLCKLLWCFYKRLWRFKKSRRPRRFFLPGEMACPRGETNFRRGGIFPAPRFASSRRRPIFAHHSRNIKHKNYCFYEKKSTPIICHLGHGIGIHRLW